MFETLFSWLLLPLGVVFGLALARKRAGSGLPTQGVPPADAGGNNNDEQAIIALSRAVETESGTAELQLTLGSLFRRRGELDRAIHLHEAVLARPGLSAADAATARYELAQDYLRAGLMDRAETLLHALVASGTLLEPALELQLDLYEQGRDWPQAIATAQQVQAARGSSLAPRIAHYRCELADSARHSGDTDSAAREAERALDVDRGCVRASLLLAQLAETRRDFPAAIRAYQRAIGQDRRYLPEALPPLQHCYASSDDAAGYAQFLDDAEADHPDAVAVTLAKAAQLRAGGLDAQHYLAAALARTPNWRALLFWLEGIAPGADTEAAAVREALRKKLEARPRYVCSSCGLQPSVLFWQCPSCKQWATIAPAIDSV